MIIIPAIDLQGREVVRLRQGAADAATQFSSQPIEIAQTWAENGAEWIHVVDLDGAFSGAPQQLDVVEQIARSVDVPIELGGGLRCAQDVQRALDAGATRVVIGSVAATDPEATGQMIATFGDRLAIGIDTRHGAVRVAGWTEASSWSPIDLIRRLAETGAARFIVTDVERDGMLSGPNVTLIQQAAEAVDRPIIASGGVQSLDDLRALAHSPVEAAIVGMALYEGCFTLKEAIAAGRGT